MYIGIKSDIFLLETAAAVLPQWPSDCYWSLPPPPPTQQSYFIPYYMHHSMTSVSFIVNSILVLLRMNMRIGSPVWLSYLGMATTLIHTMMAQEASYGEEIIIFSLADNHLQVFLIFTWMWDRRIEKYEMGLWPPPPPLQPISFYVSCATFWTVPKLTELFCNKGTKLFKLSRYVAEWIKQY